jgi:hypothetical protein
MSAFRITTKLYLPGKAPMTAINLPIRNTPKGIPYADWTMPDWEDNGWNKAMRECAIRLNDAGIPVVILENEQPNASDQGAGNGH